MNIRSSSFLLALCLALPAASAQRPPDTVFLEELTWDELRDRMRRGTTTVIEPEEVLIVSVFVTRSRLTVTPLPPIAAVTFCVDVFSVAVSPVVDQVGRPQAISQPELRKVGHVLRDGGASARAIAELPGPAADLNAARTADETDIGGVAHDDRRRATEVGTIEKAERL